MGKKRKYPITHCIYNNKEKIIPVVYICNFAFVNYLKMNIIYVMFIYLINI